MGRIVWFHARPVFPARGGAEVRCAGLVALAQSLGHEVLVVYPSDAGPGRVPDNVPTLALSLRSGSSKFLAKVFSAAPLRAPAITRRARREAQARLAEFGADLYVVSDVLSWGYARSLASPSSWVYDAHNVEHELWKSHLLNANGPFARLTSLVDYLRVLRIERRLVSEAGAVMCVSDVDADRLRALGDKTPVHVVPNSVPTPDEAATPAAAPPNVLFVGTLSYPPNVEAVEELVHRVMPLVLDQCPDARLRLVGRRPSPAIRRLAATNPHFVDLAEDVEDLASQYREARCVVIPMRSGSGTNIKLFEALSYGLPVVATPKAVEGVDVEDGEGIRVHDRYDDLAATTSLLLADIGMCAALGDTARHVFEDRLSWEGAVKAPLSVVLSRSLASQR